MPWGMVWRVRRKSPMSSPGPVKSMSRVDGFTFSSVNAVPPAATRTILRGSSSPTNPKNSRRREESILRTRVGIVVPHRLPDSRLVDFDFLDPRRLEPRDGFAQTPALLVSGQGSEEPQQLPFDPVLFREEQEQGIVCG